MLYFLRMDPKGELVQEGKVQVPEWTLEEHHKEEVQRGTPIHLGRQKNVLLLARI